MGELEFSQAAQHWANVALIWIGFGTLAGLLAKTVLPGRNPSGAVGTIVIGIAGSTLGLLVFNHFALGSPEDLRFNPISPIGMLAAAAGALVLLIVYRLLVLVAYVMIDHTDQRPKESSKE